MQPLRCLSLRRSLDDFIEEGADCLSRCKISLESADAITKTLFNVMIQGTPVERAFVAKGVVHDSRR